MPANSPLHEPSPTIAGGDPTADGQNPDLTTADGQPAGDPGTSPADAMLSPADQLHAERTERRRQRAVAHETPTRTRRARRLKSPTKSTSTPTPPRQMTLRDSMSLTLLSVLAAGGVLGAILGALGVTGWVIGLLVAGLTIVLSALLRRYSRLT
jgi:Flp pilus assembly protein TadB